MPRWRLVVVAGGLPVYTIQLAGHVPNLARPVPHHPAADLASLPAAVASFPVVPSIALLLARRILCSSSSIAWSSARPFLVRLAGRRPRQQARAGCTRCRRSPLLLSPVHRAAHTTAWPALQNCTMPRGSATSGLQPTGLRREQPEQPRGGWGQGGNNKITDIARNGCTAT